ncbi:MAG: transposase [gamma proteobacterium symbiont of Bathyaustriella thionipta]|nr:transposase [gamma proteobacterium symbiont of Bathyaustriella thionipta]
MEATLQSIIRTSFEPYRQRHGLSLDQYQAAQSLMACQTEELGYEEWGCLEDGYSKRINHSCRHRSCPKCQQAYARDWLAKTQARLLACDHYHVIFTLPHELNEIWQFNRHWSADHLFKASSETLKQLLADERYLGAQVGILASLHTWGRTLSFHPHVHLLVTGGGLSGSNWKPLKKDYLLPVAVLKAKFRGKWLSWLNQAYEQGQLVLPEHWSERDWYKTLQKIARKTWNVRIQGPYRHGNGVINYLSRYVHGGPIKDRQIVSFDPSSVRFKYQDHRDHKEKTMSLKTDVFFHRILWHVLVKGQHNIRYYGLYTPNSRKKREQVRTEMGVET